MGGSRLCRFAGLMLVVGLAGPPRLRQVRPTDLPEKYAIDPDHSAVSFAVRFMGLTTIHGAFSDYRGTLMYSASDPTRSSVTAVIQVASVNTNSRQRDHDLQGAAFFDADTFPLIAFRSTVVTPLPHGFLMHGTLTIRGVTKDVVIPCALLHPVMADAWGNQRIGFTGAVTLDRRDFGVLGTAFWNKEFDPGRMSIGDSVSIELTIEGLRPNFDRWNTPGADSLADIALKSGVDEVRPPTGPAPAVDAYAVAGLKLMGKGHSEAAVRLLTLAVGLAPKSPALLDYLGDARIAMGKDSLAREAFEQALALDSLDTSAAESLRWLNREVSRSR